jgi:hypothetical protein
MRRGRRGFAIVLSAALGFAHAATAAVAGPGRSITWTVFESGSNGAGFEDVDVSASGGWAVGLRSGGPCQYLTLAARWNGTAWRTVPSANVPGVNSVLSGVAVVSSSLAWAVGTSSCPTVQDGRTLIERWDGNGWTIVPSPNVGTFDSLSAVAAVSSADAWAVGSAVVGSAAVPLIERWDGAAWRVVAPPAGAQGELSAVSASSSADVWAIGATAANGSPVALHFDGTTWNVLPVPAPNASTALLSGVVAVRPGSAWAVGLWRPTPGVAAMLTERWDGTAWHTVRAPRPGQFDALNDVGWTPGSGPWAVGYSVTAAASAAVVLRFAAGSWVVDDPPQATELFRLGVAPSGDLFAVAGDPAIFRGVPA